MVVLKYYRDKAKILKFLLVWDDLKKNWPSQLIYINKHFKRRIVEKYRLYKDMNNYKLFPKDLHLRELKTKILDKYKTQTILKKELNTTCFKDI